MPDYHRAPTALTIALATLIGLTAGCGGSSDAEPTAAAPSTTAAAAAPADEPSEPAQPFEGTWRAGPAPFTKVVAALQRAGLGEYAETVLQDNDPASQLTSELKLQGGFVLLDWTVDDRTLGIQDRQAYTGSGSTIELAPIGSSCRAAFNWTVTDDVLRFELVDDTCPDYQGAPDAAILTGLYGALPFQRVAP